MKLTDLKKEIQKYQYMEDTGVIDFTLATIISNRLKLENPVWAIIIGASSGGKSQILRPMSLTDTKFIHRVDDLTENTFLSGSAGKDDKSLLTREGGIGKHGMISISDLTVLMSKSAESRATILSQFRMLFDGEMIKHSGNQAKPIQWQGYLGVIAGSTPSIYATFEEVSDMGERFVYYRMRDFDPIKATKLALNRKEFGKDLDDILSSTYQQYIKELVSKYADEVVPNLPDDIENRIIRIAQFAEIVRTAIHKDWQGNQDRIPVSAYPMRVAQQLRGIARSMMLMQHNETGSYDLSEEQLTIIEWVGYSLANEEKRATLKLIASLDYDLGVSPQALGDEIGLNTSVSSLILDSLTAVKILKKTGNGVHLRYTMKNEEYHKLVRRIQGIKETQVIEERDITDDEGESLEKSLEGQFNEF